MSWIDDYESTEFYKLAADIIVTQDVIAAFIAQNQQLVELYTGVYEHLIPVQDESPSELIFVFGAASDARINRAVELYKQGVAPKLLLSGHRPFYGDSPISEAERMQGIALAAGVPADAIYIETESITIPDNVKRSIDLLDTLDWHPKSVTIIATNFVLQRARMEWYKFADWEPDIKPVAARTLSEKFTAAHWFTDPHVTMLVLNEYAKMVMESKIEHMRQTSDSVTPGIPG